MAKLTAHGREVSTFFDLLGRDENAMTASLGWVLYRCNGFVQELVKSFGFAEGCSEHLFIRLQEHSEGTGVTDIELHDYGKFRIVVEAKRGFNIPSTKQLEKYAKRLKESEDTKAEKLLVVLAESDRDGHWLKKNTPTEVNGVDIKTISWHRLRSMAFKVLRKRKNRPRRGYCNN